MNAQLIPFQYTGARELRALSLDGDPWFVASDLAGVLGYRDAFNMIRGLDEDEKGTQIVSTPGGDQAVTVISEAGLYGAILRSRVDAAKPFKRWVTHEVIPAIRKHGAYATPEMAEAMLNDPDVMITVLTALKSERAARVEAEQRVAELAPAASAWDVMVSAKGDYAVGDAAKILSRDPNITIGRDRLFSYMSEQGWLYRSQGRRPSWRVRQEQIDTHRLTEKANAAFQNSRTGEMEVPAPTVRVTTKGLAELHKRLGGTGALLVEVSA